MISLPRLKKECASKLQGSPLREAARAGLRGEVLAIPAGSTIKGHVSAISTAPMRKRAGRLLNGDFTRLRRRT